MHRSEFPKLPENTSATDSHSMKAETMDTETQRLRVLLDQSFQSELPIASDALRCKLEDRLEQLDTTVEDSDAKSESSLASVEANGPSRFHWTLGATLVTAASLFLMTMIARYEAEQKMEVAFESAPANTSAPAVVSSGVDEDRESSLTQEVLAESSSNVVQSEGKARFRVTANQTESGTQWQVTEANADQASFFESKIVPAEPNITHLYSIAQATPSADTSLPNYAWPSGTNYFLAPAGLARQGGVADKWGMTKRGSPGATVYDFAESQPWFRQRWEEPHESPVSSESYDTVQERPFIDTDGENALSTFSIDVDTASYTNARRFLNQGNLPPPEAIRIEEFLNYFRYQYDRPAKGEPFSVDMELAHCPWNEGHRLLRIALKGRTVKPKKRPASNLVFLLDVSGSMRDANKLPLLKRAVTSMVKHLREDDYVSVVTYSGDAGVVLGPTCGDSQRSIADAIDSLTAGGSTNGSSGIQLAYELASEHFVRGGTNRVILATDGDLNVGVTDDAELVELIQAKAKAGVFLTVLGFGTGNLKDSKLEKLADNGNGVYAYIDSFREAQRVLVQQMSETLVTIAKDVKLQIEFNPEHVSSYRLIGYDNRVLSHRDFNDDAKDAGDMGAGHAVTALYEIIAPGTSHEDAAEEEAEPIELKYQSKSETHSKVENVTPVKAKNIAVSPELLTLSMRYKEPEEEVSKLLEFVCENEVSSFDEASEDFQFSAHIAAFGMLLRQSKYAGSSNWGWCKKFEVSSDLPESIQVERREFLELVDKAERLVKKR